MPTLFFLLKTPEILLEKLAPFEKLRSSGKEEAKPEEGTMKKRKKNCPANHVVWIDLVYGRATQCIGFVLDSGGLRKGTFIPPPLS